MFSTLSDKHLYTETCSLVHKIHCVTMYITSSCIIDTVDLTYPTLESCVELMILLEC